MVKKGEKVNQKVIIAIEEKLKPFQDIDDKLKDEANEIRYNFPKIGYAHSQEPLHESASELLKKLHFDHLRIECFFEKNWKEN